MQRRFEPVDCAVLWRITAVGGAICWFASGCNAIFGFDDPVLVHEGGGAGAPAGGHGAGGAEGGTRPIGGGGSGAEGAGGAGGAEGGGGATATCEDGSENGNESDVDCGGTLCDPCAYGKHCESDADCVATGVGFCDRGVCAPVQPTYIWEAAEVGISYRHYSRLAYDPTLGRVAAFGGISNLGDEYGTIHSWSGSSWEAVRLTSPADVERHSGVVVFNPLVEKLLVSGGYRNVPLATSYHWGELGGWSAITPVGPSARYNHAGAWHDPTNALVLFGGDNGQALSETWTFNGAWANPMPNQKPSARSHHGMAYHAGKQRTVLFGGRASNDAALDDTWLWDGSNWSHPTPTTTPPARMDHAMAYDTIRDRIVLYGGRTTPTSSTWLTDTWEFDGEDWRQTGMPMAGAKSYPSMAFDEARARMVLLVEVGQATWEYYTLGTPCSGDEQCGSTHCVDGLCCEVAACDSCQACNTVSDPGRCGAVTGAVDDTCMDGSICDAEGSCVPR